MSAVTSLSRADPTVDPGGQTAVSVKVRNAGSIVDRFDVDVVGPSAGWARVDPPSLSLFPGVEGTVTITWAPPRASNPRAGVYPFGIRVRPAADPSGSTVEEGKVSVTPFTSVAADIVPVTSRGSRTGRHQVVVANRGNASSEVAVTAEDPDARLRLMVQPPRSVVAPDAKVAFAIRVDVDDPFPFGPERQRPFQVSVTAGRQAPIALRGVLTQRPGLPGWIPPVAGVIGLVALLSIGAFLAKAGPFAPEATPTPSIAQASAPPSAAAPLAAAVRGAAVRRRPQPADRRRGLADATAPPDRPQQEIRFEGFELEDTGLRADPARSRQREPLITFKTVGPGDVVFDVTDYQGGDPNVATRVCLVPDGGDRAARTSPAPGAVTAHQRRGRDAGVDAFARPTAEDSAPYVKTTLTFFATPVGDLDRHTSISGRRRANPGFAGFNAIIRAPRSPNLLNIRRPSSRRRTGHGANGSSANPTAVDGGRQARQKTRVRCRSAPGTSSSIRQVVLVDVRRLGGTYSVAFTWQ